MENEFINKLRNLVGENISNEHFGVSELARAAGMSRSNLLRRIKGQTGLSASVFIRQIRLEKSVELLKEGVMNVSEVSYHVGFSSTSYFIKCFREYYGYPPGEASKTGTGQTAVETGHPQKTHWRKGFPWMAMAGLVLAAAIILVLVFKPFQKEEVILEKSIAVLPFINDSDDPSNTYLVNGLMESILVNLQKIKDIRVISRTSVEKYRNASMSVPEIAEELRVNYIVEGSGQKIGDRIRLNIQLIEAPGDYHLWTEQFNREVKDIFELQTEVALNIAEKIEAIIKPEEEIRIDKPPTDNLEAYEYFLEGLEYFYMGDTENLYKSIPLFEKAIELDDQFARAYADLSFAYFFLDILLAEKKYTEKIDFYAEKAMLIDPELEFSLLAKGVYYLNLGKYDMALPYLEKAHRNAPNSATVINILSDFYVNYLPDREKYLEYALKGVRLDIASHDKETASFIYLHLGNAFLQSGFVEQAEKYVNLSLTYYPDNLYSEIVRAFILYDRNRDLQKTKEILLGALARDTTRLDILQEVGKMCYYQRNWEEAYAYYRPFIDARSQWGLDIFRGEDAKIAVVLDKLGMKEESDSLFKRYRAYADADNSVYKNLSLAVYYSYKGSSEDAIRHMKLFSADNTFQYLIFPFLEIDPLLDNIQGIEEYQKIFRKMETEFWCSHRHTRKSLEEKGLI